VGKIVKKNCLRCNKPFFTKKKEDYCLQCRLLRNVIKDKIRKEEISIKIISTKSDLRDEVETLRRMEHFNPVLVERLRSKTLNNSKST